MFHQIAKAWHHLHHLNRRQKINQSMQSSNLLVDETHFAERAEAQHALELLAQIAQLKLTLSRRRRRRRQGFVRA
jgi:hypothetical protein